MPDEQSDTQPAIAEIREWLVRIETNQQHQTKLMETLNTQASNAFEKADHAEDKADDALTIAKDNRKDFDDYRKEQVIAKRWMIGTVIAVLAILAPIVKGFYV